MLGALDGIGPAGGRGRKVTLFVLAACERVPHTPVTEAERRGLALLRAFADGHMPLADVVSGLARVYDEGRDGSRTGRYYPFYDPAVDDPEVARFVAEKAAIVTAWHQSADAIRRDDPGAFERCGPNWKTQGLDLPEWRAAYRTAKLAQAELLRDILGNPFRTVAIDPAWLTWNHGTVRAVARRCHDDESFHDLPILADALEDAGCASEEILGHCRSGGPHVRGCWVVDLLLGKA